MIEPIDPIGDVLDNWNRGVNDLVLPTVGGHVKAASVELRAGLDRNNPVAERRELFSNGARSPDPQLRITSSRRHYCVHVEVVKMLVGDENCTNAVERSLGFRPRSRIDDNCPVAIVNAHTRVSELCHGLSHVVVAGDDRRRPLSTEIGRGAPGPSEGSAEFPVEEESVRDHEIVDAHIMDR